MTLPTFPVIGAQAMTTTLHGRPSSHPSIFVPAVKESNHFIDEHSQGRGSDWQESPHEAADGPYRGDPSPASTMFPQCPGMDLWGLA